MVKPVELDIKLQLPKATTPPLPPRGRPLPENPRARYFFRQTFGLGGEQETVEDGPNQLAGKRDIDRASLWGLPPSQSACG
jgi:hypothetical protein